MLRFAVGRVLVAASLIGILTSAMPSSAAAAEPVLWGAYISGVPYNMALLGSFEASAGKPASIVHWGQPWVSKGAPQKFQTDAFERVRQHGSIPMVTWGSWDSSKGKDQPDFKLARIIDGTYDGFIRQWASDAAAWGKPLFLRFDHEMNGTWQFPWAEKINGNQPGEYVRAWRHVHDIFVEQGASNVTWVWCPNISGATTTPLSALYPGDSYVDWTGMDGYNWGTDTSANWQTFAQVFGGSDFGSYNPHNTYQELLGLAPNKPIMLGEVSSTENGGSKASWIADMLQTQLPTNFPQIKAVVWTQEKFDNVNWLADSSQTAMSAFAQGIGSGYYAGNEFGGLSVDDARALANEPPVAAQQPPEARAGD